MSLGLKKMYKKATDLIRHAHLQLNSVVKKNLPSTLFNLIPYFFKHTVIAQKKN